MTRLFIDADACPVKDEAQEVAARHDLEVFLVSSQGARPRPGTRAQSILVGPEFDAADDWIVARIGPGDVAVTADIQLAARCLEKQAAALNPNSQPFTPESIGSALAMRELNAYLRESGAIVGQHRPFSKADRSAFVAALERAVQQAKHNA